MRGASCTALQTDAAKGEGGEPVVRHRLAQDHGHRHALECHVRPRLLLCRSGRPRLAGSEPGRQMLLRWSASACDISRPPWSRNSCALNTPHWMNTAQVLGRACSTSRSGTQHCNPVCRRCKLKSHLLRLCEHRHGCCKRMQSPLRDVMGSCLQMAQMPWLDAALVVMVCQLPGSAGLGWRYTERHSHSLLLVI